MIERILSLFGLGGKPQKAQVSTVKLDIIAEQVKEFNEAKTKINEKIQTLETRTNDLGETVNKTLDMTKENQKRLNSIEDNLTKLVEMSESLVKNQANNHGPNNSAPQNQAAGQPTKKP